MKYSTKEEKREAGLRRHREYRKRHPDKDKEYYENNKLKIRKREKDFRKNNKDKINKRKREFYKKHRKQKQNYSRMIKYGISEEDFNKMFEEQQGCCAICGKHQSELDLTLCIDHNHITGEIRGLLCKMCNTGLGCFYSDNSNLGLLQKAMIYLNKRIIS